MRVAAGGSGRTQRSGVDMKRKPDLVMALVLIFGVGVVATGYAQTLLGA